MAIDREATARRRRPLSEDELDRLRQRLGPELERASADVLVGGLDTASYRLRLWRGTVSRDYVVRIYRDHPHDASEAVRRDFAALTALSGVDVLAPTPILGDPTGEIVGEPLVVMTFIDGSPVPATGDVEAWARQMADALAMIHRTSLDRLPADFRRGESAAARVDRMVASPPERTDALWSAVAGVVPRAAAGVTANAPTLVHGDFWFGNTIWRDGRLTGIIDWDGARIDDPALDVSIARNDIVLFSGSRTADVFLQRYEELRGPLAGLLFWDLVACLAPIKWLAHWVEGYQELGVRLPLPDARKRLEAWVETRLARLAGVR